MTLDMVKRRLRGAIGTAVVWAGVWAIVGLGWRATQRTERGSWPSLSMFAEASATFAVIGLIAGLVFSLCIATDGRRRVEQLSSWRVGGWGALSACVIPLSIETGIRLAQHRGISLGNPGAILLLATVGALCGVGSLLIAQRGVDLVSGPGNELHDVDAAETLDRQDETSANYSPAIDHAGTSSLRSHDAAHASREG